jgi:hypothetical protein
MFFAKQKPQEEMYNYNNNIRFYIRDFKSEEERQNFKIEEETEFLCSYTVTNRKKFIKRKYGIDEDVILLKVEKEEYDFFMNLKSELLQLKRLTVLQHILFFQEFLNYEIARLELCKESIKENDFRDFNTINKVREDLHIFENIVNSIKNSDELIVNFRMLNELIKVNSQHIISENPLLFMIPKIDKFLKTHRDLVFSLAKSTYYQNNICLINNMINMAMKKPPLKVFRGEEEPYYITLDMLSTKNIHNTIGKFYNYTAIADKTHSRNIYNPHVYFPENSDVYIVFDDDIIKICYYEESDKTFDEYINYTINAIANMLMLSELVFSENIDVYLVLY